MKQKLRLIDADELMEHAGRDKLDSRELIMQMIENAPTINPKDICEKQYREVLQKKKELYRPTEHDSDWWYNRNTGIIDGLQMAFEAYVKMMN